MGVIRNWACLNGRCGKTFESWDANPECPKCGCVRVQWVPGGGHVAGTARAADAELRTLADNFGLNDIMSARRGERAKPPMQHVNVQQSRETAVQFAPGFAASVDPQRATCQPSMQKVNFKTRLGAGQALGPGQFGAPSVSANTKIEASHRTRP